VINQRWTYLAICGRDTLIRLVVYITIVWTNIFKKHIGMLTPSHTTWFVRFKNADRCEKSLNVDKLNSKSDKNLRVQKQI